MPEIATHPATHPDRADLIAFANGRLPDDRRAEVEAHVSTCTDCCGTLEGAAGDSLVDLARLAAGGMTTPSPGGEATPSVAVPADVPADVPAVLAEHPRYQVVGRLGAGGMGVVYKAEHRMMGRTVAIKLLNPGATAGAGAVERFRREVRVSSRVSHPNIVTAFDADEAGGRQFLVMEYVDGVSLDRLVARRGPLAVPMACQFARLAALALQHAHEHGMVHRDVKPQNMMVTRKGQLKVLDFGLARAAQTPGGGPAGLDGGVTNPELVVGTPDYLSPEQAKNSTTVDIRSDVYSLGCTLFFMLTGRTPFAGESSLEKMIAHVKDDVPDVTESRSDLPPGLAAVVARMMAKNPADRPQSPAEAAAELAPFARSIGPASGIRPVAKPAPAAPTPAPVRSAVAVARPPSDTEIAPPPRRKPKVGRRPRRRAEPFVSRNMAWIAAGLAVLIVGPLLAVGVHRLSRTTPTDAGEPDRPAALAGNAGGGPTNDPGDVPDAPADVRRMPTPIGFAPPPTGPVRVLMVLPPNNVWLPDVGPLYREFETESRVTVETASVRAGPIPPHPSSTPPLRNTPAMHALADVDPNDYHAVLFMGEGVSEYLPGGPAEAGVRRIIDACVAQGKPVGAVCVGIKVLGEHGYLDGRTAARVDPKYYDRAAINWTTELPPAVISAPFITVGADVNAQDLAAVMMVSLGVRSPGTPPKTGHQPGDAGPRPGEPPTGGPDDRPGEPRPGGPRPGERPPGGPRPGERPPGGPGGERPPQPPGDNPFRPPFPPTGPFGPNGRPLRPGMRPGGRLQDPSMLPPARSESPIRAPR